MQLSVIIVNYNVRYFLEHCLLSVVKACQGIDAEIFVVDNNSQDGSAEMVKTRFPQVRFIANPDNPGFAKANNQALELAEGQYILYLNPDTIVPEDCLQRCLQYMDAHPDAGALGCRLIDGKGQFLPESKRGFPSARVAFYKISGLSAFFKKSKRFNQYHLGYLPEHEIQEVDVLVGCFMFCRKSVIDQCGSFDPDYFMYGEDIDLSYRIQKAGFKNIYFPETTVIHYKGESTKKGSLNYVKMFYQAMIIFAKKHFQSSQKRAYVFLIQLAIYLKAMLTFGAGLFTRIRLPLIDALMMLGSLWVTKNIWTLQVKTSTHYSSTLLLLFFSVYILIWLSSLFFSGTYDHPYRSGRLLRGMLVGGIISIALYGLLSEDMRFSRGITVIGALIATLLMLAYRWCLRQMGVKSLQADSSHKPVVIIGTREEESEVRALLQIAGIHKTILGSIHPGKVKQASQLGVFADIRQLARIYDMHEMIFVQNELSFSEIIQCMQDCGPQLEYKIHSRGSDSIIGSNSKDTAGDLYTTDFIYNIDTPANKRNKRLLDILVTLFMLLVSPALIWIVKNKKQYFGQLLLVLKGDKTLVGYRDPQLPPLREPVFNSYPEIQDYEIPFDNQEHLDYLYAREYHVWTDLKIILKKWRSL